MYWDIAHYAIQPVDDPEKMVKDHKVFLKSIGAKGRIYISEEGINSQLSIHQSDLQAYVSHLKELGFSVEQLKKEPSDEHIFARLHVRYRPLVDFKPLSELGKSGTFLTPSEWKKCLEEESDIVLIDARNDYESELGYFKGAIKPQVPYFRDFIEWTEQLKKQVNPEKVKVLSYCTGGIRCEYYTPFLRKAGFKNVYHLKGGVIQYGLEYGNLHWKGRLFVFDDRLSISLAKEGQEDEIVGRCTHCNSPCDVQINCANMQCNRLFISCLTCRELNQGCCGKACMSQEGNRAPSLDSRPKPFRRLSDIN